MKKMRMRLLRISAAALSFLLLGSAWVYAGDDVFSPSKLPKAKGSVSADSACVEPVDEMRRNHMNFILHQRDATMHEGIRTSKHSLVECINCHVTPSQDGQYPRIDSEQHFCTACHAYAAVTIDCFQCHATKPEQAAGGE